MRDALDTGEDPVVEAYKKDIDRTLIRKAMAVARFADELRRAGREGRGD